MLSNAEPKYADNLWSALSGTKRTGLILYLTATDHMKAMLYSSF
uniref:Uncharacterized protein n=1 Tax=Arundo donax TaxID=35708 RepID=A0A0A9EM20_ARUDO